MMDILPTRRNGRLCPLTLVVPNLSTAHSSPLDSKSRLSVTGQPFCCKQTRVPLLGRRQHCDDMKW